MVQTPHIDIPALQNRFIVAECEAGKKVLGGGYVSGDVDATINSPQPDGSGWQVFFRNRNLLGSEEAWVYAICANT